MQFSLDWYLQPQRIAFLQSYEIEELVIRYRAGESEDFYLTLYAKAIPKPNRGLKILNQDFQRNFATKFVEKQDQFLNFYDQ